VTTLKKLIAGRGDDSLLLPENEKPKCGHIFTLLEEGKDSLHEALIIVKQK
jgi:hypothetical protein